MSPGEFAPADEYDSYAPHIVSMVVQGGSREQIFEHLQAICIDAIGVEPDRDTDWEIAGDIMKAVRDDACS